jgi:hypothetical protein
MIQRVNRRLSFCYLFSSVSHESMNSLIFEAVSGMLGLMRKLIKTDGLPRGFAPLLISVFLSLLCLYLFLINWQLKAEVADLKRQVVALELWGKEL